MDCRTISRMMTRCGCLLVMALLPVMVSAADFQTPALTALELNARQATPDAYLIIDVREPKEYRKGHIPGAINIPHTELDQQLDELQNPNGVVVYCINGRRTKMAEQTLLDHGFENLYHIEYGLAGWLSKNLPVTRGRDP